MSRHATFPNVTASGTPQERHALHPTGFLYLALEPDIKKFIEQWHREADSRGIHSSTRKPVDEVSANIRHVEALWSHLMSYGAESDKDQYLTEYIAGVSAKIRAMEEELEATKDQHRRARSRMLSVLCERRRRAVGVEIASTGLMLPAQATSAVADAEAKNLEKDAAVRAIRRRPWALKEAAATGSCEEGEVRMTLDHRRLLDIFEFDPGETCRDVAASTSAAVRARFEAQKLAWSRNFEEEKDQLEAKIREVCEEERAEAQKHEALVARLMMKFEAHQKRLEDEKARGQGKQQVAEVQGSFRASILGGANASAASSSSAPPPRSAGGAKSQVASQNGRPDLELMREMFGRPLSEDNKVKQWGATLVGQLGLNFYPSKPKGWIARVAKSQGMAPPKVAASVEEAFAIDRGTDESLYLSRYLLGPDRLSSGASCDPSSLQAFSPPASTTASTQAPHSAGNMSKAPLLRPKPVRS